MCSFSRAIAATGWLLLTSLLALANAEAETTRYLIISAPRLSKIVYSKVGGGAGDTFATHPLIDSGLRSPQGLAVDQARGKLYVADPDSRKIFVYDLKVAGGALFTDSDQKVAVTNVEARWVAVDILGHLFFTDERSNLVQKATEGFLQAGGAAGGGTPVELYSGKTLPQVSAPGGIAADNFHVFWTNKRQGTQVGSVVKGPERQKQAGVRPIATNAVKVYGVCLADHNVYYTENGHVYGVKKMGGAFQEISSHLKEPRGCIWDGDGTVYVADKTGNAIYSFPGNMHSLGPAKMTKTVDQEDAFGLAILSGGAHRGVAAARFLGVLLAALAALRVSLF